MRYLLSLITIAITVLQITAKVDIKFHDGILILDYKSGQINNPSNLKLALKEEDNVALDQVNLESNKKLDDCFVTIANPEFIDFTEFTQIQHLDPFYLSFAPFSETKNIIDCKGLLSCLLVHFTSYSRFGR
jgi:hypothetical protein